MIIFALRNFKYMVGLGDDIINYGDFWSYFSVNELKAGILPWADLS